MGLFNHTLDRVAGVGGVVVRRLDAFGDFTRFVGNTFLWMPSGLTPSTATRARTLRGRPHSR